jgi:uncharacterized protein YjiS (DUF1127 family)
MLMFIESFVFTPQSPTLRFANFPRVVAGIRSELRRAWKEMQEARQLRHSMAALERLDTRTLSDIGIDRSEIASVVLNPEGERRRGPARQ